MSIFGNPKEEKNPQNQPPTEVKFVIGPDGVTQSALTPDGQPISTTDLVKYYKDQIKDIKV